MNKVKSKKYFIIERNEQKEIAIKPFDFNTNSYSFTNADKSKKRLKKFYDIAYKNILFSCTTNNNDALKMAWDVFKEKINIENIKKRKCISFFVFGSKTYKVVLEGEVFFIL